MRYELSERARADVKAIIVYTLENFGRQQADEYTGGLFKMRLRRVGRALARH